MLMTEEQSRAFAAQQKHKALELFARWEVTHAEGRALLGNMDEQAYATLSRDDRHPLDDAAVHRLNRLVLIDEWLMSIFNEPQRRYRWMRAPNDLFNGKSAIEVMLSGELADIERVHDYLKAEVYG
jgi:uncharacterized protein (DUF2384 family)